MFRASAAIAAVSLASLYSQYARADFDFSPKLVNGQVATGGHDDEAGVDTDSLRVGTYDFGGTPGDPYNTGDPGFNTNGASAFTAGSQLRVSPLAIGGVFLRYWDGTGTPNFSATPGNESIQLAGSPTRLLTFSSSAAVDTPVTDTSLLIGSFASNGALHVHLTSSILENGIGYDPVTGDPVAIPAGDYLISFKLTNPGTGAVDSQPLYIVYNNGLSDEQTDAAVNYVNSTYVPEPSRLGIIASVAGFLRRRRRPR